MHDLHDLGMAWFGRVGVFGNGLVDLHKFFPGV